MTMTAKASPLEQLWEAAVRCLPVLPPEEQRVGMALLRALAAGEPVTPAQVAQALDAPFDQVESLLRDSALTPYVHTGEDGRIQGVMGLSVARTQHQFTVSERRLWTWCAYDALFLPELLGETAEVETRDPETGESSRLTVSPDRIQAAEPAGIVASIVGPQMWDHGSTARLRGSACQFMFFFTSQASAVRWHARHPETVLLPIDQAFAFGKRANAHRFGAELARHRH